MKWEQSYILSFLFILNIFNLLPSITQAFIDKPMLQNVLKGKVNSRGVNS